MTISFLISSILFFKLSETSDVGVKYNFEYHGIELLPKKNLKTGKVNTFTIDYNIKSHQTESL